MSRKTSADAAKEKKENFAVIPYVRITWIKEVDTVCGAPRKVEKKDKAGITKVCSHPCMCGRSCLWHPIILRSLPKTHSSFPMLSPD